MSTRNQSISVQMISTIVLSVTIILIIYAAFATLLYRNREIAKLYRRLPVATEQLQTTIGGVLWNYNPAELNNILDAGMKDITIAGIVVKIGDEVYSRSRNELWEAVEREPVGSATDIITHEQPILYLGKKIGTLTLLATTKFLNEEIMVSIYFFGGTILLLDIFLILTLYWIFRRIILEPLKKLESYAISVSSGDTHGASLKKMYFRGELDVLRSSLENMLIQLESRYAELIQEAKRLMDSEKLFRILVNTIPDLIWLKNSDGVYLSCNKMFERFFGASEADIIGKTDYDFVDRDLADFFREHDHKVMSAGKSLSNEESITFADDGHHAILDTTKTPMYNADGKLIGVLGIARDITARKLAEEEKAVLQDQLSQAQKIESIGRLAGGVAHDFNNMLGVIIGHADLAQMRATPSDLIREDLSEIISAANRSADLTRQLLAFARKQAVSPMILDLNATLNGMLKMLRRLIGEDIDLVWVPGDEVWPVKIDPSQLDQILANLCINARDAIKDTGKVIIETKNVTLKDFQCAWHSEILTGDFAMLSVSDTGCGIDKDMLPNIFEPFYTTKEIGKGTGLGLATVYGAVRQNDGFINVHSEPDHGATFQIYLPRNIDKDVQIRTADPGKMVQTGTETVLIVEDELSMLRMITKILENQGYTVLAAATPGEAFSLAKTHSEEISLLITDVIMPEMNGRDLADSLKSFQFRLKSLFMSGYTADIIAHHGVLDEGVQFIQKPFSSKELAVKVREILDNGN